MNDRRYVEERITLKYGAGGSAMRALIEQVFAPGFGEVAGGIGLSAMDDGAALPIGPDRWLVITTDAHVVQPAVFPGGDIGRLAVCGTVNDLAMMGAKPLAIALGLILAEGLDRSVLEGVLDSIAAASKAAGVPVVTGDTKVVGRNQADGMYITTAGIGSTP